MILYEYPFNERIRNLLRLEDQFDRLFHFVGQEDPRAQHAGLSLLFEISDAIMRGMGRSDVRTELMQELERQRHGLMALRDHPGVDRERLDATIDQLQEVVNTLATNAKPADMLRQNEWLAALRSRLVIPGGACDFDMPSYHAWQHKPVAERQTDLARWCAPLIPLHDAVALALRLLRQTGESCQATAAQGLFQQIPSGKPYQLLQVRLPAEARHFPEIIANKYSISIRFCAPDGQGKPQPVSFDVPFELVLCANF